MLYADDGPIGLRDLEWLQIVLNVLIILFCKVRLMDITKKYRKTTCHMGEIHTGMSEEDFNQNITGDGATYWEPFRSCNSCLDYWVD